MFMIPRNDASGEHERVKWYIHPPDRTSGSVSPPAHIPDITFIAVEKLIALRGSRGRIQFAPDLAVEVISESESAADADKKIGEYFAAGCLELRQVYSNERRVRVPTAVEYPRFGADRPLA